jgi:hypothetical protein
MQLVPLQDGKTPTGANFRLWLTELVEGRGVGRGAGWQNEHSPFFSHPSPVAGLYKLNSLYP